jgi:transaldolase
VALELNKKEGFLEVHSMLTNRPKTKILVDGGDPEETLRIRSLIGFVDGQTTNPSLVANFDHIERTRLKVP